MIRAPTYMRFAAAAWLLAAVVPLIVTLLRPEMQTDERAALAPLVPLYFLSFPLGHVGVMALSRVKLELYAGSAYVLAIREEGLLLWLALTVLGLLQWFVLLPWLARKSRQLADFLSRRLFAR